MRLDKPEGRLLKSGKQKKTLEQTRFVNEKNLRLRKGRIAGETQRRIRSLLSREEKAKKRSAGRMIQILATS